MGNPPRNGGIPSRNEEWQLISKEQEPDGTKGISRSCFSPTGDSDSSPKFRYRFLLEAWLTEVGVSFWHHILQVMGWRDLGSSTLSTWVSDLCTTVRVRWTKQMSTQVKRCQNSTNQVAKEEVRQQKRRKVSFGVSRSTFSPVLGGEILLLLGSCVDWIIFYVIVVP